MDHEDISFVLDTTGTQNSDEPTVIKRLLSEIKRDKESEVLRNKDEKISKNPFEKYFNEMGYNCNKKATKRKKGKSEDTKETQALPLSKPILKNEELETVLKKSQLLQENFEQQHSIPKLSEKKLRELRKKENEKTKGKKWFNLPAPEMTKEVKNDLEILQMRSVLDPKHFYKKNDLKVLPKYFQIGKVLDSPLDFYSGRLTRKERKKTLVDELLANEEFQKYNKRRYQQIQAEKQKTDYRAHMQAKRLKRKNKK